MTHTVKSGDTLAKIARTNGISLEQLLEANPRFRANPNSIRVGDLLNIPDGQSAPVVQPPTEPQPQRTQEMMTRRKNRVSFSSPQL